MRYLLGDVYIVSNGKEALEAEKETGPASLMEPCLIFIRRQHLSVEDIHIAGVYDLQVPAQAL